MTDWTTERGDGGAASRPLPHAFTGTTLLMTTEQLLAVLEDWPGDHVPPAPARPAVAPAAPEPAAPNRPPPIARTAPRPAPRPGLLRRLRCARRGHDPRPHRPLPHDAVVYRCLRCGLAMPAPGAPPSGDVSGGRVRG